MKKFMQTTDAEDVSPHTGKANRVFLTAAYLKVLERNTFALYRNLEQEVTDETTGKSKREKMKEIGPIGIFRPAEGDEVVELRTVHPVTGQELKLKCISRNGS